MAVNIGKAEGKITLDASGFVSNINKAYQELEEFNKLIDKTQSNLSNMSSGSIDLSTSGLGSVGVGSEAFSNIEAGASKSVTSVGLLQSALKTGLSGALTAVGSLAKATFAAFRSYVEETVGFAKNSLETGLNFDATMSKVSAISGATGKEFDDLRKTAIEMGAQTKFSATEAGEAMSYMGMAGWKAGEIIKGLPGVMSLAAASGEDLATTSDIVTDALTAFGLKAENSTEFADVLAAAATKSNTNVGLMGETFKYVASMAGTMKYSVKDTAIAIGLMANSGIKGSQAGTALRNVITNLASPSTKVAGAMQDLGLSLTDAEGNTKSLMQLMQDLRGTFSELSGDKSLQNYALEMDELNEKLDTGKITEEQYEESKKAFDSMIKSTDAIKAQYASIISGKYGLSGLLAIVNATDEDFENLTREIYNAGSNLTEVNEAVKGSGVAWDSYVGDAEDAESQIKNITNTIVDNIKDMDTSDLQTKLEMEFGLNADDALLAINSVKESLQDTSGAASTMEQTMMDNLQGSITVFKSTLETFKIGVSDALKGPANEIVNMGQQAISKLTLALKNEGFPGLIRTIRELLPELINTIVSYLPQIIPQLLDGFWSIVNGIIDALPEAIPILAQGAMDLITGFATGLVDAFHHLNEMLPGLIKSICDAIIKDAPMLLEAAINLFSELVTGLAKALPKIIKAVAKLLPMIVRTLTDNINLIVQGGIDLIMGLIEGLTDPETISALLDAVFKVCTSLISGFTKIDWLDVASKIFSGLGDGLKGVFQGAMSFIDQLLGTNFGEWAKDVTAWFDDLKRQSFEFGKYLAEQSNKAENELNELSKQYYGTYEQMLAEYANLVKSGMNGQDALAAAYQKFFISAEAQEVFQKRFASTFTKQGSSIGERIGTVGMSDREFIELISRAVQTSGGNTYNIYSPEPLDEKGFAAEVEKTQEEMLISY